MDRGERDKLDDVLDGMVEDGLMRETMVQEAEAIAQSWAETGYEPRVSDQDSGVVLARGFLALQAQASAEQKRVSALQLQVERLQGAAEATHKWHEMYVALQAQVEQLKGELSESDGYWVSIAATQARRAEEAERREAALQEKCDLLHRQYDERLAHVGYERCRHGKQLGNEHCAECSMQGYCDCLDCSEQSESDEIIDDEWERRSGALQHREQSESSQSPEEVRENIDWSDSG